MSTTTSNTRASDSRPRGGVDDAHRHVILPSPTVVMLALGAALALLHNADRRIRWMNAVRDFADNAISRWR
jgi:hypothetical protein